jgi:putative FmdB family regulatory protein
MPLFEFRCRDCGGRFEVLTSYQQSLGEMLCTVCQSQNVHKLIPLVAKRSRGDSDDYGDDYGDDYDDGGADMSACGCGGACDCRN